MTDLMAYDAYCNVLGSTNSEHAAALYITNLTGKTTKDSWQKEYPLKENAQRDDQNCDPNHETPAKHLGDKKAPNSLNFCTTDGKKMVAIRFRNHATQQPPSLYWSEFAGRTLNRKFPGHPDAKDKVNHEATKGEGERIGKHTIVASEPTPYDAAEWHLIGRNCALTVDEKGTETESKIEYDEALNAVDPSTP